MYDERSGFSNFPGGSNSLSRKSWYKWRVLEYLINWEICHPYASAAEMLLHLARSFYNVCQTSSEQHHYRNDMGYIKYNNSVIYPLAVNDSKQKSKHIFNTSIKIEIFLARYNSWCLPMVCK
jgi:hypothetical protein